MAHYACFSFILAKFYNKDSQIGQILEYGNTKVGQQMPVNGGGGGGGTGKSK